MNRNSWLVLPFALSLAAQPAVAQGKTEIAVLGGWQFGGKLSAYEGDYSIDDAFALTGTVDITVRHGGQLELMYDWQGTAVNLRDASGKRKLFDANLHYFQVGGLGYVDRGNVRPFGVATLGLTYIDPTDVTVNGLTKFSFTLGAGAKVLPTQRVGVRFEGRLLMTVVDGALGLGCGPGGCSGGLWGWGVVQGVVSGGLIVLF